MNTVPATAVRLSDSETQLVSGMADTRHAPAARRPPPTSPLTAITPVRPGWTFFQRIVFDVLPHTPWGASTDLERLAFIHSARWAIVRDLWAGGSRHRPRYDYLLFESNYDGPLGAYLEAFADVLGPRMRLVWNSSFGFPNHLDDDALPVHRRLRRPIPGRAFVDYVRRCDLRADHYYRAYDASTRQILQGLLAREALEAGSDPAAALARMRGAAVPARQPRRCVGDVRGDHVALTTLTPIVPGREGPLRELLAGLDSDSPFAEVPGLHHARWVIVDDIPYLSGAARDAWSRAYLLMTSTLDRAALHAARGGPSPAAHLQRHLGTAADDVYRHCEGGEGRADLAAYLQRHRIVSQRFYSGYPYLEVAGVVEALAARTTLLDRVADLDEATGGAG